MRVFFPTATQIAESIMENPKNWRFSHSFTRGLQFKCGACGKWHEVKEYGVHHS